jgi:4-amino-4-deoxy-L-arabinose transferase-like glycosyltransferase
MDDRSKAALILAAGALVRLVFWLTTPVTGDALFHYSIAKYISDTYSVPTFEYVTGPNPFWWPPLFHIITALLYKLTGVLTLTPLVFGLVGLFMFYVFCRRFYPNDAVTATLVLAFLPFHVYYSSVGYFETLMFFLAVCAFY